MTRRMYAILLLLALGVTLACVLAAAIYTPMRENAHATIVATRTMAAETVAGETLAVESVTAQAITATALAQISIAQTQTAAPTMTPTLTRTPTPLPTPTLTPTPTPTPTPTLTPTPEPNACQAEVIGSGVLLLSVPGGNGLASARSIAEGSPVQVLYRLADPGWFYVDARGTQGWLYFKDIRFTSPACSLQQLVTYNLSNLLNLVGENNQLLIDDTFNDNRYRWLDSQNMPLTLTTCGTSVLEESCLSLNATNASTTQIVHLANPPVVGAFNLTVSFWMVAPEMNGYIALRFRSAADSYYEVRIYPDSKCSIEIDEPSHTYLLTLMGIGENQCNDGWRDFVTVSMDARYNLYIQVNDSEQKLVVLSDPGIAEGGLELGAFRTRVYFDYLILTAPR